MRDWVDLTKCWHRMKLWEICDIHTVQSFSANLRCKVTSFTFYDFQVSKWNEKSFQKGGVVENKWSNYPVINDRTWFPGSVALIFVSVRYMRRSVAAEPRHHKPILNYSPHKGARQEEHYKWIPSPTSFLSIWWYPPKSNGMTSSCPPLALALLSNSKQGHQQIPRCTCIIFITL